MVPPDAKKQDFRHIAEIEANAPSVRRTILADFFPNNIPFIRNPPSLHNRQTIGQERIGYPKIQVAFCGGYLGDGQGLDFLKLHGFITVQPLMLRRNLPGSVLESPGRIRIYCGKFLIAAETQQIIRRDLGCLGCVHLYISLSNL